MSLYSLKETCEECINAEFHKCCGNFCRCKEGHEDEVNYLHGSCKYKTVDPIAPQSVLSDVSTKIYTPYRGLLPFKLGGEWHWNKEVKETITVTIVDGSNISVTIKKELV